MSSQSRKPQAFGAVLACILTPLTACARGELQPLPATEPSSTQDAGILIALVLTSEIHDPGVEIDLTPSISRTGDLSLATFRISSLSDASKSMGAPTIGFTVLDKAAFDNFIVSIGDNPVALILDEFFYEIAFFYSPTNGSGYLRAHGEWRRSPWADVLADSRIEEGGDAGLPIRGESPR